MDTDFLIRHLAGAPAAVRPLPRPSVRLAAWLAMSLAYVAMVVVLMMPRSDLASAVMDPQFLVEQSAALATAASAAFAAFCMNIPGRDRRVLALPLAPLSIWLASLGSDCLATVLQSGWSSLRFEEDWMCLPAIALAGAVPAALIVFMLRRGAPLAPGVTMALGGLAAAGLGSFGLRLFHAEDASLMVLVWQLGTVALLSAFSASLGPYIINWRRLVGGTRNPERIG